MSADGLNRVLQGWTAAMLLSVVASVASAQDGTLTIEEQWAAFDTLSAEYDAAMAEVDATDPESTRGSRERIEAIDVATRYVELIEFLVINDRSLTSEDVEGAWDLMLTAKQVLGSLQVEVGQCSEAQLTLQEVLDHPETADRANVAERAQARLQQANACVAEQEAVAAAAAAAEGSGFEQAPADLSTPPPRRGFRPGHGVLIGGGAALIGAVAHDLAMGGTRSDFVDARDACESGLPSCDVDEAESLQGELQTARIISAILYGAGIVGLGTGTVMLVLDRPDQPDTTVELAPLFGFQQAGFQLTVRR